jgi:hypothetical protein
MNIRYINRRDIDVKAWNNVITNSSNALIYAESWYLDITCNEQWGALVLDDYSAVMPLPYNRKLLGYYQISQPQFAQQLGVFSSNEEIDVSIFIVQIPKKFKRMHYALNHGNVVSQTNPKTNLIIDLKASYSEIVSNFSSSLKKRLKKMTDLTLSETSSVTSLIDFYQTQLEDKVQLGREAYKMATDLFTEVLKIGAGKIYVIKDGEEVLAMGMFLFKHKRLINIFGASRSNSNHSNSMSALLARVLEKYSEQDCLFDFEGSEIPGVQQYFKSFGSIEQNYSTYHFNRLPFWLKIVRKN